MINRIKHAIWKLYTGRTLSLHEFTLLEQEKRELRRAGSLHHDDKKRYGR